MGYLGALQIIFDIFAGCGIFILLMKLARAPKDDPRLSRGLQILQSKIAILEDLSDRTENQVRGLMALLDQKNIEVQTRIEKAGEQVRNVENSIRSSMDVAKIFQDKIPHQEIIERQNTLKYLHAARLANQGMSVEQIVSQVDLPMGEIEFIAKVNREQLSFSVEELPPWAQAELAEFDRCGKFGEPNQSPNQNHIPAQNQDPIQNQEQLLDTRFQTHFQQNSEDGSALLDLEPYANAKNQNENENEYGISSEIAPLASYVSEPHFQVPNQTRELTPAESKNLSTLKRTKSIIANLDKQFSMSGFDVQEEEPPGRVEPEPTKVSTYPLAAFALTASEVAPVAPQQPVTPASTRIANANVMATTPRGVTRKAGSYDPATIRKVVFPVIQASKANQNF